MAGKQKTEVLRLAGVAEQAAAHERDCRAQLAARGKKLARTGLVIGGASAAGFLLISVLRRDEDDRDRRKRKDSRGPLERAGDHFMTLVRWGATASHLWTLVFSPQPAAGVLPEA
jgi:hypothetical protein